MDERPTTPQVTGGQMRIVHAGLAAGLVVMGALSLWVSSGDTERAKSGATVLKVLGYGYLAVVIPVIFYFRRRIGPRRSGVDRGEWWQANVAYAIIVWALVEGAALFGILAGWLTGSRVLHVGAAVLGLLLLYWFRPGKLEATR